MLTATNAPRSRPVAIPVSTASACDDDCDEKRRQQRPADPRAQDRLAEGADAEEGALPERRDPGEPNGVREPDRGEREVDEAGEIGHPAGQREHRWGEQRCDECHHPQRRRPAPGRAELEPPRRTRFVSASTALMPARNRLGAQGPVRDQAQGEREREDLTVPGAEPEVADPQVVDRSLGQADSQPGCERPRRTESDDKRRNEPFSPSSAPVSTVNGAERAASTAASAASAPTART